MNTAQSILEDAQREYAGSYPGDLLSSVLDGTAEAADADVLFRTLILDYGLSENIGRAEMLYDLAKDRIEQTERKEGKVQS